MYDEFKTALSLVGKVLYLCDNAGEIVFDRILIEELQVNYPIEITAAVRGGPGVNAVILEDARQVGLDQVCRVISNGFDAPGTIISDCSREFTDLYRSSDLIISKGQGNFETLWGENEDIFFLFKIKCDVVARHVKGEVGDTVLMENPNIITFPVNT